MPLLNNKVSITKDKLARRNWDRCKYYCFCDSEETIKHLFISHPSTHIVWCIVHIAYIISSPINITNMFENWLIGIYN
jgi:hypothetical protein